jgi:hypothetical protein
MSDGICWIGLPTNVSIKAKFAVLEVFDVSFMDWFKLPPTSPSMKFSTPCQGIGCKKKQGDPGVQGRVRCRS